MGETVLGYCSNKSFWWIFVTSRHMGEIVLEYCSNESFWWSFVTCMWYVHRLGAQALEFWSQPFCLLGIMITAGITGEKGWTISWDRRSGHNSDAYYLGKDAGVASPCTGYFLSICFFCFRNNGSPHGLVHDMSFSSLFMVFDLWWVLLFSVRITARGGRSYSVFLSLWSKYDRGKMHNQVGYFRLDSHDRVLKMFSFRNAACFGANGSGSSLILAWSPTAKYLVTGGQDSSVHFWWSSFGEWFSVGIGFRWPSVLPNFSWV
jgi:hypothetical protein